MIWEWCWADFGMNQYDVRWIWEYSENMLEDIERANDRAIERPSVVFGMCLRCVWNVFGTLLKCFCDDCRCLWNDVQIMLELRCYDFGVMFEPFWTCFWHDVCMIYRKWLWDDFEMILKWFGNNSKMILSWHCIDFAMILV